MEPTQANDKIIELQKLFHQLEEMRSESKSLDTLRGYLDLAQRAQEGVLGFRQRLADIFSDPEKAFHKFAQIALNKTPEDAANDLLRNPDDYGMLKGWSFGPLNNPARAGVLKLSLPAAARTGLDGFTAHMQAGGGGYTREDLGRKIEAARLKLEEREREFGSTGRRIEMELQIAELAKEISFRDLANLPKEQYRTVETLRDKYRTLMQAVEADPARRMAAAKKTGK